MADDVQVSSKEGGNGFKVDLKQRQLGITGPIVVPVLCLAIVAWLGWIQATDRKEGRLIIETRLQAFFDNQEKMRIELNQQTQQIIKEFTEHRDKMFEALNLQNIQLLEQTRAMRQHHAILLWNQSHPPEQHLHLDLPIPEKK